MTRIGTKWSSFARIWIFLEDLLWCSICQWVFGNNESFATKITMKVWNSLCWKQPNCSAQFWSFHLKKWVNVLSIFQHNKHGVYQATVDEGNPFVLRVHWWTNRGFIRVLFFMAVRLTRLPLESQKPGSITLLVNCNPISASSSIIDVGILPSSMGITSTSAPINRITPLRFHSWWHSSRSPKR